MTASVTQVLAHRIARGDGGGSDGNGSGSGEHTGGGQHERAAAAAAADPPYIPGLTQAAFALDDRRDGTAGAAGAADAAAEVVLVGAEAVTGTVDAGVRIVWRVGTLTVRATGMLRAHALGALDLEVTCTRDRAGATEGDRADAGGLQPMVDDEDAPAELAALAPVPDTRVRVCAQAYACLLDAIDSEAAVRRLEAQARALENEACAGECDARAGDDVGAGAHGAHDAQDDQAPHVPVMQDVAGSAGYESIWHEGNGVVYGDKSEMDVRDSCFFASHAADVDVLNQDMLA